MIHCSICAPFRITADVTKCCLNGNVPATSANSAHVYPYVALVISRRRGRNKSPSHDLQLRVFKRLADRVSCAAGSVRNGPGGDPAETMRSTMEPLTRCAAPLLYCDIRPPGSTDDRSKYGALTAPPPWPTTAGFFARAARRRAHQAHPPAGATGPT